MVCCLAVHVLLQVVLSTIYIMAGDISDLISAFNASIWTYYCLSFVSLLIMRVTYRHESRPFKVWVIVPALMVLVSLAIVVVPLWEQGMKTLGAFGIILFSIPVYFVFVCEKSHLRILRRLSRKLGSRKPWSGGHVTANITCCSDNVQYVQYVRSAVISSTCGVSVLLQGKLTSTSPT